MNKHSPFHLGDVISGEPHLYCGYTPPRWAPRSMDLDVLLYGDLVCEEPGLKLPRPDLLKRAYMLGPLAALAPQVMHPTAHLSIGELWRRFDQSQHELVQVPAMPPERT